MFGLALLFVYVFFCPFSSLITLLGKEGAGLCAYRVLAMQRLICVTFCLPPGVGSWLWLLLVALPGLFCLTFFSYYFNCVKHTNSSALCFAYLYTGTESRLKDNDQISMQSNSHPVQTPNGKGIQTMKTTLRQTAQANSQEDTSFPADGNEAIFNKMSRDMTKPTK